MRSPVEPAVSYPARPRDGYSVGEIHSGYVLLPDSTVSCQV